MPDKTQFQAISSEGPLHIPPHNDVKLDKTASNKNVPEIV